MATVTALCRSIFCCLAPSANSQYVRQEEGPVVIRPIAPQPPNWTEPVLGPQLPQDVGKKTLVLDLGECCLPAACHGLQVLLARAASLDWGACQGLAC